MAKTLLDPRDLKEVFDSEFFKSSIQNGHIDVAVQQFYQSVYGGYHLFSSLQSLSIENVRYLLIGAFAKVFDFPKPGINKGDHFEIPISGSRIDPPANARLYFDGKLTASYLNSGAAFAPDPKIVRTPEEIRNRILDLRYIPNY